MPSPRQSNVFHHNAPRTETKETDGTRQFEPPRSCRTRVKEQRPTQPFDFRLMRVPEDADVRLFALKKCTAFFRQFPAFIQHMSDRHASAGQLHNSLRRKPAPFEPIDIAGDRRYGSDGLEVLDDGSCADIAGVEDAIHAGEMPHDRRIEQSVGIGYDTDADHA